MASHFECLGFPFTPESTREEDMARTLEAMFQDGRAVAAPTGFHAVEWTDDDGTCAYAVVRMDRDAGTLDVQDLTPLYAGETRQRGRVLRAMHDEQSSFTDYLHVEMLEGDAESGHPIFMEMKAPGFSRNMDLRGDEVLLQTTLLGQKIQVFANEADFVERRPEDLETRSFTPTGLMGTPPQAKARVSGIVTSTTVRTNAATGGTYRHAVLDTFGGTYDLVVADDDDAACLVEGCVVLAECYVIGRLLQGLPAEGSPSYPV